MKIRRKDDRVALEMGCDELARLAVVLNESVTELSRAEFFIRTGGVKSNFEHLIEAFETAASGNEFSLEFEIVAGVENEENPRRPRTTISNG